MASLLTAYLNIFTGRNEVVAKVMFLETCVCPQGGGGCLPQCMHWYPPPRTDTPPSPWDQADPPGTRQMADPPWDQEDPPTDQADTPPGPGRPPRTRQTPRPSRPPRDQAEPPPPEADSSRRSMSGRYASYWNAFLY